MRFLAAALARRLGKVAATCAVCGASKGMARSRNGTTGPIIIAGGSLLGVDLPLNGPGDAWLITEYSWIDGIGDGMAAGWQQVLPVS